MKLALAIIVGTLFLVACGADATPTLKPVATPPTVQAPASTLTPIPIAESTGGTRIKQYSEPPSTIIQVENRYVATLNTNKGAIVIELFPKEAPRTVNNFVFLARDGFYDGISFHRVIKDFMIQGGDPTGTGAGGPGYRFEDEPVTRDYVRGTLAMANSGPNTNGSQFFIVHKKSTLPKQYNIFGIVVEGLDVVDSIATTGVAGP